MWKLLKLAWAQIILTAGAGLLLSSLSTSGWTGPLHHIGIGLLVAAVVTSFWHLREFSEFFEKFARAILIDHKYLEQLNLESLTDLRSKAAQVILESRTDNPDYKHHELGEWIDQKLFDAWLPGKEPRSGIYREGYREEVTLQYLTLGEALAEVKEKSQEDLQEVLGSRVLKVTSVSRYTLVAPRVDSSDYRDHLVTYTGRAADLPGFPIDKRLFVQAGHGQEDAVDLNISVTDHPEGGVEFKAEPIPLLFKNGECEVWMRSVEYQSTERQSHILNTMAILTKGLDVNLRVVGAGPKLIFEGDVIATGNADHKTPLPGSVSLVYEGWLFEGHGYYIWWWEADV